MTNTHGRFSPDTREFPICIHCQKMLCKNCSIRPVSIRGTGKNGNTYYNPTCTTCRHEKTGYVDTRASKERKGYWNKLSLQIRQEVGKCEKCGFVPEHLGQLDVDHIDGDPKNNDRANLMVLCSNCHRLKTIQNVDWVQTMNRRYQESTGQRRATPAEYVRLSRAKKNLLDVTPEYYRSLSRKEKISKVRSICTILEITELLKV